MFSGLSAMTVIIILELLLAVYSVALVVNAKSKALRITHIVLTVFWVVMAVLNVVGV